MVSKKILIILITIAIILSIASIAVTISTLNSKLIPESNQEDKSTALIDSGEVSLIVLPQSNPPNENGKS